VFRAQTLSGPAYIFHLYSCFLFFWSGAKPGVIFPTKNPRLTGNRGFVGNLCYGLENSTHDAKGEVAAVPNGHQSIDLLLTLLR
jgi:hypothetical protein